LEEIVKKLVLSLLLSVAVMNAFGMQTAVYDYRVELAKQDVAIFKTFAYPIFGSVALGIAGYFGSWMWYDYMEMRKNCHEASLAAKVPVVSQPASWAPYAKIAAGLGLTGLSAYLGCKQTPQPQSLVSKDNVFTPNIVISFASAYTLAPMVPAYFLFKSGFEDLKAERDFAYHKEYAKTALAQISMNAPAATHV
jgi:hypothetical protein